MKKRKTGRTLSRDMSQRKALLRTLMVSLIENKSIKTTLAKAKELRPFAERQVTYAKKGLAGEMERVNSIRNMKKSLPKNAIEKLFDIAEFLKERQGGYLRIVKLGFRKSDSAEMALIEWVDKGKMIEKKSGDKKPSSANATADKKATASKEKEDKPAEKDKKGEEEKKDSEKKGDKK